MPAVTPCSHPARQPQSASCPCGLASSRHLREMESHDPAQLPSLRTLLESSVFIHAASLLVANGVPLEGRTASCLSIHWLTDVWVLSMPVSLSAEM